MTQAIQKWRKLCDETRERMIRDGAEVTPAAIVEEALNTEDGRASYEAAGPDLARAHAVRDQARALKESADDETTDPAVLALFDAVEFTPPRTLTVKRNGGRAHKAVEWATEADEASHEEVLTDNVVAVTQKRDRFRAYRADLAPYRREPGEYARLALERLRADRMNRETGT